MNSVPSSFWTGSHITVPDGFIPFQFVAPWFHMSLEKYRRALSDSSDAMFVMHTQGFFCDVMNDITVHLSQNTLDKATARDCLTHCLQTVVYCHRKGLKSDRHCVYELLKMRSELCFQLNDLKTAAKDINLAKYLIPARPEAWLLAFRVLMADRQWDVCVREAINFLSNHVVHWDPEHKSFAGAAVCMTQSFAQLSELAIKELPRHSPPMYWVEVPLLWKGIVARFCHQEEYDGLGIITVGQCDNLLRVTPPNFPILKAASIPGIKFDNVNIGKILYKLNTKGIKKWHLKMGEFFIQRGASVLSIPKEFKSTLLVSLVMLSLHADAASFLEFAWDNLPCDKLDEMDGKHGSAYHYLAREMAKTENRHHARTADIIMARLYDNGCVPILKDKDGKQPYELLPEHSSLHTVLKEAVTGVPNGLLRRLVRLTDDAKKTNPETVKSAVSLYELVADIQSKYGFGIFNTQLTKSLLKLAIAYFKAGDFVKCHGTAYKCYKVEKEWAEVSVKTCYWLAVSSEKLGKINNAYMDYMEGFTHHTQKQYQRLMLREGLKLLPRLTDNSFVSSVAAFPDIWDSWDLIVEVINQNKLWSVLKIFYLGPPYEPDEDGQRGLLWSKTAVGLDLHSIWDFLDDEAVQAPRLLLALLQRRANYNQLSSDPKEGLHAVVRFCASTNDMAILRHVLGQIKASGMSVNCLDANKRTPLHVLCLVKNKTVKDDTLVKLAKMLYGAGCDVTLKDSFSKLAADYAIGKLKDWMNNEQGGAKKSSSPSRAKQKQGQECGVCEDLMKRAVGLKSERKYPQMYLNLVTVINEKGHEADKRHRQLRQTCVERITNTLCMTEHPDIPTHLMRLCSEGMVDVTRSLIERKKWMQMKTLITHFKISNSDSDLAFLHENLPIKDVLADRKMCEKEEDRCMVVRFLLDNGAKMDPQSSVMLLKHAMQASEFKVVLMLLKNGADLKGVTFTDGDTPLHAALRIALYKDSGNFEVFDWLTSKIKKDKAELDWACCDKQGNNLLHVAAKANYSHFSMMAVERLCKNRVPITVKNKNGKLPRDLLLDQKDRRAEFLRSKSNNQAIKTTSAAAKTKSKNSGTESTESTKPDSTKKESSSSSVKEVVKAKEPAEKLFSAKKCRKDMKVFLTDLPEFIAHQDSDGSDEEEEQEEEDEEEEDKETEENALSNLSVNWSIEEETTEATPRDVEGFTAPLLNSTAKDEDCEIDSASFDNLLWEVECTEDVWNFLKRKEDISVSLKREIVTKIHHLAKGDWSKAIPIELENVEEEEESESMRLYRVNLTKGFVLFEVAVAFSPKLKDAAQSGGDNLDSVYSEIIRVWNVVSTTTEAHQTLQKILLSHRRGKECYVKESLDCKEYNDNIQKSQDSPHPTLCYPLHYAAAQVSDRTIPLADEVCDRKKPLTLCPPASTGKMEFHILKFYSFSSTLASAVLNNNELKVDFPFKVTPLEHQIISLPCQSPVLLLGRSGTGKTTICVYRLWKKFMEYWERERHHGQPLLARDVPAIETGQAEETSAGDDDTTERSSNSHATEGEKRERKTASNGSESNSQADRDDLVYENAWMEEIDEDDDDDDDDDNGGEDGKKEDDSNDNDEDEKERGGASSKEKRERDGAVEEGVVVGCKRRVEYHHLHQVFVTKNHQLCSEVGETFQRLRNSVPYLEDHSRLDDVPLPNTLQDLEEQAFPLFITSRQLLLLLDASLDGKPFFDRDENLALKLNIPGWGTQENIFHNSTLEGSSDEELGGAGGGKEARAHRRRHVHDFRAGGAIPKRQLDKERECTYEVFAHEVWSKIAQKKVHEFHPSLVWTEIMSIIKGSYEALQCKNGYLPQEKYLEVGQKRAPNFCGDRMDVYVIFKNYLKFKREKKLFDEADLVFNIYTRLREMSFCKWVFDEIYVDELQDFTQAELTLLISLSHQPNKMFLTGDTAQSIMHGISFRFNDLKSLFYFAKKSQSKRDKEIRAIKPPGGVHPLRYNYRSHSGILSLASSVLDLLTNFFPESYDVLDRDQGLFDGPKPVLIESCSQMDLALLLSGNQRQTSHIEFGAHQAILVTSQQAKDDIPPDLKLPIVLTIYESKGLEFDDILLYNFFKDSQASKTNEWRVVTEFLNCLVEEKKREGTSHELDTDILNKPGRPHPLTFNPSQHKILNTELKHLYTAVTRARVNVWIFDEDRAKSAPVFEYFKVLRLIKTVGLGEKEERFGEQLFTKKKSTAKEWYAKADLFMKRELYEQAARCFSMAKDPKMETFANAHHKAQNALRQKQTSMFLEAASLFVQCDNLHSAASCFLRAKEYNLAALAFEKNGEWKRSADQYKRASKSIDASRCFERAEMFDSAMSVLVDYKEYERALDCLHRYHNMMKDYHVERKAVPQNLVDHRPRESHSEKHLLYMLAEDYLTREDEEMMFHTIERLDEQEDQFHFLADMGYSERAARILDKMGRTEDAANLMLQENYFQDGLEYARRGGHVHVEATIHLIMAQIQLSAPDDSTLPSDCEEDMLNSPDILWECEQNAHKALDLFQEMGDDNGKGQAMLVLGSLKKSIDLLNKAHRMFQNANPPNVAGQIEAFQELFSLHPAKDVDLAECRRGLGMIKMGMQVMKILRNPTKEEEDRHLAYLTFYGLDFIPGSDTVSWNPNHFPISRKRISSLSSSHHQVESNGKIQKQKSEVVDEICNSLVADLTSWVATVGQSLKSLTKHGCDYQSDSQVLNYLDSLCLKVELNDLEQNLKSYFNSDSRQDVQMVLPLMDFLPPLNQKLCVLDSKTTQKMLKRVRSSKAVKSQFCRYLLYKWDNPSRVERGKSTDVTKERAKESDWLVSACLFEALFGLDIHAEKKAHDLEIEIMRLGKEWAKMSRKCAIVVLYDNQKRITAVETLGGRFIQSFQILVGTKTTSPDPYEAIFKFTKLLSIFSYRAEPNIMPALKHLVFWLEFYCTLTFCFIGKASQDQKASFYLPSSYFHHLDVINACRGSHSGSLLTDIVKYKPKNIYVLAKHILDRQTFLINFLVGRSRHSNFSLLDHVPHFCGTNDPKDFLIAERIIVLACVLLMNTGSGFVKKEYNNVLHKALCYSHLPTEALPQTLAEFILKIPTIEDYKQLLHHLSIFLRKHRAEPIMQCSWENGLASPIQKTAVGQSDSGKLPLSNSTLPMQDLNTNNSALEDEDEKEEEEEDVEEFEEVNEIERQDLERQAKQRQLQLDREMKAVKVIIKFLRDCVTKSKEQLEKNPYHKYEERHLFAPYILSSHRCGVCGVDLVGSGGGGGEEGRDAEGPTRERHEMSGKHESTFKDFKLFKQVYNQKVFKDLMEILKFMEEYQVNENSRIYSRIAIDVNILVSSLSAFQGNVQEIMMKRDWAKHIRMTASFGIVINHFQKNKNMIKRHFEEFQQKDEDRQRSLIHAETMADGFVDDSMDTIDLDPYDKPVMGGVEGQGRRRGGGGRGRRNRGNRGGQRRRK